MLFDSVTVPLSPSTKIMCPNKEVVFSKVFDSNFRLFGNLEHIAPPLLLACVSEKVLSQI